MKRLLRWMVGGVAATAGLLGIVAIGTLGAVDRSPYFKEPYYAVTMSRLQRGQKAERSRAGVLASGFGRVRLTPSIGSHEDDPRTGRFRQLPLAGFGNRSGRPATGTHDELEVKAVALQVGRERVVMIGVDALIVPPEVTDLVMEQLGRVEALERRQVYLSATHTHCSLGGWGEGVIAESFAGPFHPGARIWMAECIVQASRAALGDLRPARLGRGRFLAPEFVRNRLVGSLGRIDPEFSFLLAQQEGGRLAVLGSFAAHATVLGSEVMEFSGDYPGYWQRTVEEMTGGMGVFLAGGMASHGPVAGAKGFAGAERLGRALAERTVAAMAGVRTTREVTLRASAVNLVLPPLNVRVTDGVRLRPWLARRLLPVREECVLQGVRCNEVVWLSTPCDYSGELALNLKDFLRARGADGVVTSFNGGYMGYVVPHRYIHLDGYEPRRMSFHGPNVADYFDETLRTIAEGLLRP